MEGHAQVASGVGRHRGALHGELGLLHLPHVTADLPQRRAPLRLVPVSNTGRARL